MHLFANTAADQFAEIAAERATASQHGTLTVAEVDKLAWQVLERLVAVELRLLQEHKPQPRKPRASGPT